MSIAGKSPSGKSIGLVELAQELHTFAQEAAKKGVALRDLERGTFDRLLKRGFTVVKQFLEVQGNGDLGATVAAKDGLTLDRSEERQSRPLRTIFGQQQFLADVYRQQLSVDTLEAVNQQRGEEAGEFLLTLTVPPTEEEGPPTEEEGELLILTCDGKGVPRVKADADQLRCFEERPQRPGNRRMATLAGVYSVDRYVRTPEQILAALFRDNEEVLVAVSPRPEPCHKRVIACLPRILEEVGERSRLRVRSSPSVGRANKSNNADRQHRSWFVWSTVSPACGTLSNGASRFPQWNGLKSST